MESESPADTDHGCSIVHATKISMQWGVRIPLRDGITLNAAIYHPIDQSVRAPCIVTLTPYGVDTFHEQGSYFAARGYPFAIVDIRGRGASEGNFRPHIQEANDGYDVIEWIARQPYCNSLVAMWGGSYSGYTQWATAKECPPHLAAIAPTAAPYVGIDVPMRNNIFPTEVMQYLTLVSGRAAQLNIYRDQKFWAAQSRRWYESGRPFRDFDLMVGNASSIFQEYLDHPNVDAYWDAQNPTAEQYAQLRLPILTITGIYDDDQPGALAHYRKHMQYASAEGRARHYLVIGPWDHAGTRAPKREVGGLTFGTASMVDLKKLHLDWYRWTMQNGPLPAFLRKQVVYYVTGTEVWRYADTLESITVRMESYFLHAGNNGDDFPHAGSMTTDYSKECSPACYVYDPSDTSGAELESMIDPASIARERRIYDCGGKQLVYHSDPFAVDRELSGFFALSVWLSIDQLDTDFAVAIYEIGADGSSILLSTDRMRARYRESLRMPELVRTSEPLRYDFTRFTFVSRRIKEGNRLRLVVGPINSIYSERNFNSGGLVAQESIEDARAVKVTLYQDEAHPSALYIPIGVDS